MDKLAALRAFAAVVEEGSFAAAARAMGLSRSQVNRAVINLENDLGVQLLHRTTRNVSPTMPGEQFHSRCTALLGELREAEEEIREVQTEPRGELRINAPMSFGTLHLGPAVADFMRLYPEIRISLVLSDRFVDPLEEGYDLTLRITGRREQSALIDHEVIETRRVLCAAPGLLSARGTPERLEDLGALPCLHYGSKLRGNRWKLEGPDGERTIAVNTVLCADNAEVLRDAALRELGVALLPTFIIGRELQEGRLQPILPQWRSMPIFLTLLYPPLRHRSGKLRVLIDFLYDRFGRHPVWENGPAV